MFALGLILPSSGCHWFYHERSSPIANVVRTMVVEPWHYSWHKNDYHVRTRNKLVAMQAWEDLIATNPHVPIACPDYRDGFIDGFSDYLYAGGTGEPPPLPPRHYWTIKYETPAGRAAIEQWFAGFRHGAAVCRISGLRELAVPPSSVLGVPALPATMHPNRGGAPLPLEFHEHILPHERLEELPLPSESVTEPLGRSSKTEKTPSTDSPVTAQPPTKPTRKRTVNYVERAAYLGPIELEQSSETSGLSPPVRQPEEPSEPPPADPYYCLGRTSTSTPVGPETNDPTDLPPPAHAINYVQKISCTATSEPDSGRAKAAVPPLIRRVEEPLELIAADPYCECEKGKTSGSSGPVTVAPVNKLRQKPTVNYVERMAGGGPVDCARDRGEPDVPPLIKRLEEPSEITR